MSVLVTHFSMLSGAKLIKVPLAMIVMLLLARTLGPEGMGRWAMLVAVAMFFQSLSVTWTQAQAVRLGRHEWVDKRQLCNVWAARRPLVFLGLGVSAVLLAWQPFSFLERISNLPADWWLLCMAYLLALSWTAETQIILQTTGRFGLFAVLPLVQDAIVILCLSLLLLMRPDPVLAIQVVVTVTAICAATAWIIQCSSARCWGGRATIDETLRFVNYGWPLFISLAFGYLSDWGDHFLLQHFLGAGAVGLFQAAYQAMIAMMALAAPIAVILLPNLVDKTRVDPTAELHYLRRTVPIIATLWMAFLIPCICVLPAIFRLVLGQQFAEAIQPLLVLCVAVPGSIFSYLYSVLFEVQGRTSRPAVFITAMTITNLALSVVLIPKIGLLGAAIGTTISYLLVQALLVIDQHRYLSAELRLPALLMGISMGFGVLQYAAGEEMPLRAALALIFVVGLVVLARVCRLSDSTTVSQLCPARLRWFGRLVDRMISA